MWWCWTGLRAAHPSSELLKRPNEMIEGGSSHHTSITSHRMHGNVRGAPLDQRAPTISMSTSTAPPCCLLPAGRETPLGRIIYPGVPR